MEKTVSQKLQALLKLQKIDSKIDEIKKVQGDLPDEVQDLEDEVTGYKTRIQKFKDYITGLDGEISDAKNTKKDSERLIDKYKEQQMNVKNNREYDALAKEIESEELEMILCDKKIKECSNKISLKKKDIDEVKEIMNDRKKDLENKKGELDQIISESNEEEEKLLKDREKQSKNIEEPFFISYEKLRNNSSNGLAVVIVRRNACGGCFNVVPPQRQVDIKERKKLIICEHCGRILADVEIVIEPLEKPKKRTRKATTKKTTTKKTTAKKTTAKKTTVKKTTKAKATKSEPIVIKKATTKKD